MILLMSLISFKYGIFVYSSFFKKYKKTHLMCIDVVKIYDGLYTNTSDLYAFWLHTGVLYSHYKTVILLINV